MPGKMTSDIGVGKPVALVAMTALTGGMLMTGALDVAMETGCSCC